MENNLRIMSHTEFSKHCKLLSNNIGTFLKENSLKVDYVVPLLRSGAVPAVYIANNLNIVKFAPFQVKHIKYKDKRQTIEIIYNPLENLKISKLSPVFLVVEGTHSTGKSAELCINAILDKYPKAKIIYACVAKAYGSLSFKDKTVFETYSLLTGKNIPKEQYKDCQIEENFHIYPWENLKDQIEHPDDLEDNIFF